MTFNIFENRRTSGSSHHVPVWFMRQAGRYHDHYQNLKKSHSFIELCKNPELALETTMGPIREFDFDAAILFSDLLFPLEHLGMGLEYNPGPKLGFCLEKLSDLDKLKEVAPAREFFDFQKQACKLLRSNLDKNKTLLGFVGAPFTLYTYAVEGSHAGALVRSKTGLYNGLFEGFMEKLLSNVLEEMIIQAEGGADAICIFDTAAGELGYYDYQRFAVPKIKYLTSSFKEKYPDKKIIYYSKHTTLSQLKTLEDENIDVLGIDWRLDIVKALEIFGDDYYIQGNMDPCWLHLEWTQLEGHLKTFIDRLSKKKAPLNKWIFGLGHGVLQHTPQENVKKAVELVHKQFLY